MISVPEYNASPAQLLTSSRSKGKYKYYWYYECANHRNQTSAINAHSVLNEILDELSLSLHHIDYIIRQLKEKIQKHVKTDEAKITLLKKQRITIKSKIDQLEEKYILSAIDQDTYRKW